ncbi:glycosyltransferase [Mucilaginibacter xinganensis]|uniref:Glycosyl transferases group 1 n=1 Tax=Mucilaginibacter xinganensis TaxID=1234841 RepID=A0A223NYV3_9SPHI|nr:glycosyltransferase [Mucilaginibacter xinganensis]ASU34751.1 Glycosyl transferases group 1 [Mucilaginibacter xinganensis]
MDSINKNIVFVSMSDAGNGAEKVMLMAAAVSKAPMIFLTKVAVDGLCLPADQPAQFITSKGMIAGFLGLANAIKKYRHDFTIIASHSYLSAYLGFLKRIGYIKSKLIVRECTSVFTRFTGIKRWTYRIAYYLGYPAADLVICQTDLMKAQFISHVSYVKAHKVIVVENPVDITQNLLKADVFVNDPDLDAEFICAAGRLIPEKGFSILIRAYSVIAKQYPALKLLILGHGPDKANLIKLIYELGLERQIILKGRSDNPMPYFKRAKVCVVSSIKEGFPNVLLEMMSLNHVVVATLCAGGIESIPGIYKADVNNTDSLMLAIKDAIELHTPLKKNSTRRYLQNRQPEVFISSILNTLSFRDLYSNC